MQIAEAAKLIDFHGCAIIPHTKDSVDFVRCNNSLCNDRITLCYSSKYEI